MKILQILSCDVATLQHCGRGVAATSSDVDSNRSRITPELMLNDSGSIQDLLNDLRIDFGTSPNFLMGPTASSENRPELALNHPGSIQNHSRINAE